MTAEQEPAALDPESLAQVQRYIEMVVTTRPDNVFYRFIHQHGQAFTHRKPCEPERCAAPYKECFRNAYRLMIEDFSRYTYVEGIAAHIIPVHHAWCIDQDGHVIDPTWNDGRGAAYFGVPFKSRYVLRTANKMRVYGVLMHNEDLLEGKDENWKGSSTVN